MQNDDFELIGQITKIEIIAVGSSIMDIKRLRRTYSTGRWRKMKGVANIRQTSGRIRLAEIHWYESAWNRQKGILT